MYFYNKTTLLPSLDELYILLIDGRVIKTDCLFCVGRRIAIEHKQIGDQHFILIWKTHSIFDCWYGKLTDPGSEFIAALDYTINPDNDNVKIDYIIINDGEHGDLYKDYLDPNTAHELNENLVKFIEIVANVQKTKKIIMDVHNDLRIYNKYYKPNGFELTDRKCKDNPYWIETEKYMS